MKRSTKSITAFILTLLLIIASPVAAFAGTIEGDSTVETVVINVVLPSDLDFALDPLGLDVTGDSQIATANYFFLNQTFAPVRVELDVTVTAANEAELAATTSAITGQSDPGVTDKLIYFGALGATDLSTTITATDAAIVTTDSAISYPAYFGGDDAPTGVYPTGTAISETLVPVVPGAGGTTGSAVIGFALAAAVESSTTPDAIESLAANNDGVAAFQFYAQLNTYADWQAGDVSVTGNYTLVPLRGETYDTYHAEEVGLNQYIVTEPEPEEPEAVGFIGKDDPTEMSINVADITSGSALVIPFNFGENTLTRINMQSGTQVATDQYTVGTSDITFTASRATALKGISASTYYTVILSDSSQYTINFIK